MEKINILDIEEKNQEIIKNDFFVVKYLYFEAGKGLFTQIEQAMVILQVIEGKITFVYGKEEKKFMMPQGMILEFDGRETYSIIAHENSKALMIISTK